MVGTEIPLCVIFVGIDIIVGTFLTGFLCDYGFAGGWPSAFYVFGVVGCVWSAAWLWAPAQRKRATMLYFANVFLNFFMAALFSGPGERRFAKVLHVVDLECH